MFIAVTSEQYRTTGLGHMLIPPWYRRVLFRRARPEALGRGQRSEARGQRPEVRGQRRGGQPAAVRAVMAALPDLPSSDS